MKWIENLPDGRRKRDYQSCHLKILFEKRMMSQSKLHIFGLSAFKESFQRRRFLKERRNVETKLINNLTNKYFTKLLKIFVATYKTSNLNSKNGRYSTACKWNLSQQTSLTSIELFGIKPASLLILKHRFEFHQNTNFLFKQIGSKFILFRSFRAQADGEMMKHNKFSSAHVVLSRHKRSGDCFYRGGT